MCTAVFFKIKCCLFADSSLKCSWTSAVMSKSLEENLEVVTI